MWYKNFFPRWSNGHRLVRRDRKSREVKKNQMIGGINLVTKNNVLLVGWTWTATWPEFYGFLVQTDPTIVAGRLKMGPRQACEGISGPGNKLSSGFNRRLKTNYLPESFTSGLWLGRLINGSGSGSGSTSLTLPQKKALLLGSNINFSVLGGYSWDDLGPLY